MGVWVCVSSETVWFPTLIGQKQGSLREAIRRNPTIRATQKPQSNRLCYKLSVGTTSTLN